jgi:hypothetical protein
MAAEREDIERLLLIMANLPEFLRLSFARRKVSELCSMNESDRRITIRFAVQCLSELEPNTSTRLITSWIKEMCEIEPTMLVGLMESYSAVLSDDANFFSAYPEKLATAYRLLSKECQDMIIVGLKEAVFLSPDAAKLMKMLPISLKTIMGYEKS